MRDLLELVENLRSNAHVRVFRWQYSWVAWHAYFLARRFSRFRFRLWPDNPFDQSAKKGYSLEKIRIRLGRRQRNLTSQYLQEPFGVLDVADTMDIGVLQLRRALFCG